MTAITVAAAVLGILGDVALLLVAVVLALLLLAMCRDARRDRQ